MRQRRRALGRGGRSIHEAQDVVVTACGHAATDDAEGTRDPGQEVVEVVGDAAGQLADGVHLLALAQLLLGGLPVRLFGLEGLRPFGDALLQRLVGPSKRGLALLKGDLGCPHLSGDLEAVDGSDDKVRIAPEGPGVPLAEMSRVAAVHLKNPERRLVVSAQDDDRSASGVFSRRPFWFITGSVIGGALGSGLAFANPTLPVNPR